MTQYKPSKSIHAARYVHEMIIWATIAPKLGDINFINNTNNNGLLHERFYDSKNEYGSGQRDDYKTLKIGNRCELDCIPKSLVIT
jgi:hypothetical protein